VSILVPEESAETARTLIGSAGSALSETEEDDRGSSNEEVLRSIRREVAADDPLLRYIAGKARQTVWLPVFVLLFASYLVFPVARRYSEAIENGALAPIVAIAMVAAYFWFLNRLDPVSRLVFQEWRTFHRRRRIWTNILSVFSGLVLLLTAIGAREFAESQAFIAVMIAVSVGLIGGGVALLFWKHSTKRSGFE
jgi:hypothetical protein